MSYDLSSLVSLVDLCDSPDLQVTISFLNDPDIVIYKTIIPYCSLPYKIHLFKTLCCRFSLTHPVSLKIVSCESDPVVFTKLDFDRRVCSGINHYNVIPDKRSNDFCITKNK